MTTQTLQFGAGPICRGYTQDEGYTVTVIPTTTTSAAGGAPDSTRDVATSVVSGANVDSVFSVQFTDAPNDGTVLTNLTPGIATFVGSAHATWVSNGLAQIQAAHPVFGTSLFKMAVQRVTGATATKMTGYVSGSVAADLSALIDNAIVGVTASSGTTARFSNLGTNTRNAALWCKSVMDDTAITREIDTFTLNVLIGPKHALYAAHVGIGGQLGFVGSDGVGYVATVVSSSQITNTDIGVAYLRDATAPEIAAYNAARGGQAATQPLSAAISGSKIKPMAMLPATAWAATNCPFCLDFPAGLTNFTPVPVFHTTRNNCIGVWDITAQPQSVPYTDGHRYQNEFFITPSIIAARAPFASFAAVGSTASGDITFTAIPAGSSMATNNAGLGAGYPILLGTTHGSADNVTYKSPFCALSTDAVKTAMQALATAAGDPNAATYQPITISLTGYTSY